MTAPSTRAARWIGARRRTLVVGTLFAAGAAVVVGGTTLALWSAQAGISGGRISAGDLTLERGDGSWTQVTPGVTEPASGDLETSPESFISMPGDVIEFELPITTTLQGANLQAALSVEAGSAASEELSSGSITAVYRVENAAGEQVAPATGTAELGELVTLAGLTSSNEGVSTDWTVVVTVNVQGDYRWTQKEPLHDLASWTLDDITVELQQVREGEGLAMERRGP